MKKFRVSLVRECTQYATVEVEATSEDAATDAAQDWLDNGNPVDWDLSDDKGKPRVCEDDVEELESDCDEGCIEHAEGCDGYCDHLDHKNACRQGE